MQNWFLLFIPVGIFFFIGSIFWIVGYAFSKKSRNWVQTMGQVVDSVRPTSDSHRRPVFEFETKEGELYRVTSRIGQRPSLPIGMKVPVLYDPNDPNRARIDLAIQGGRFFMIFGTIFLAISVIILLVVLFVFT